MSEYQRLSRTTTDPQSAEACREFYARFLRLTPGVEAILTTADTLPDDPAVQLASAFLWLFGQTPEAQTRSGEHLTRLGAMAERLNPRERAWLAAMRLWHTGAFEAATQAFEAITTHWPEDLPAAKATEFLYYILGQQESGPRFLAHMERLAPVHRDDPDFLAIKAFAHELCGQIGPATELAERALELTPLNPWAHHALEHALLWEGSPENAVARLESWLELWDEAGRFIHCHNAWHVALMHLDRLSPERAWAIYERHVWSERPAMVVEQLDSISFLWRAEMAGVPVDQTRYQALIPHIEPLAQTLFMPFVTAQYAYTFARAGATQQLESLLARVDERAAADDAQARHVWAPVGRAIIHGCAALGSDRPATAAQWMDPVMDKMMRIGGSDAQDDLFRFAHWESLRRAGRKAEARTHLARRLAQKRPSPLEEKLLAAV